MQSEVAKMKNKTKGGEKSPPKSSTERSNKRKAEMQAAAILNGFQNWSAMMTHIKNMALAGKKVVK
jgi:hypothetical protein